jgi:hypothetical protein
MQSYIELTCLSHILINISQVPTLLCLAKATGALLMSAFSRHCIFLLCLFPSVINIRDEKFNLMITFVFGLDFVCDRNSNPDFFFVFLVFELCRLFVSCPLPELVVYMNKSQISFMYFTYILSKYMSICG